MRPDDAGTGFSVRNNPYAGPQELKLKQVLETNFADIVDTQTAWHDGAADLETLSTKLGDQRDLILDVYSSDDGAAAAATYTRLIKIVDARKSEMTEVATALTDAKNAAIAAWGDYNTLPEVSDPFSGDPTAGITGHGKKAIKKRTEALKDAQKVNDDHTSSVNAAEAKAREALARLDTEMEKATDKIRPVAGMEKPGSVTNPGTTADITPTAARPKSHPGVINNPENTPISPVEVPHNNVLQNGNQTTPIHHTDPVPGPTDNPNNHNDGHLLGPVNTATPPVTAPTPVTNSPVITPSPSPSIGPVVSPTLSTAAISRPVSPVPGATQARTNAIGRSSTTASRGVLGRNAMMPGQSAAGRSGTTAGRGGRGMMPGQSGGGKGSRGTAGSRGGRGAGGRGMVPGTGGAKGKGKNRDGKGESIELLWDDGKEWLGEDETSPEVLT